MNVVCVNCTLPTTIAEPARLRLHRWQLLLERILTEELTRSGTSRTYGSRKSVARPEAGRPSEPNGSRGVDVCTGPENVPATSVLPRSQSSLGVYQPSQ
jgi:hypothetical protein